MPIRDRRDSAVTSVRASLEVVPQLAAAHAPLVPGRVPNRLGFAALTASGLPADMSEPGHRDPYRVPLIQFVWDWNISTDREAMIREVPVYTGDDALILPAIAAVVHALAVRDGVPVPPWVKLHRRPAHAVLFGDTDDGWYGRWLRRGRAPTTCEYHRVWFHHRLLDKGTPDWWLPWD